MPSDRFTSGRERPMASPGSLIVTFAGRYLRRIGGWIAVADLISLLATTGQRPAATRAALVRLKSRGFVASETRVGRAGYRLTEHGLEDLAVGDARIFRYGEAGLTDDWVLAVFSVPDEARAERHQLRQQLVWQGFSSVGSGVCIAPATLATGRGRTSKRRDWAATSPGSPGVPSNRRTSAIGGTSVCCSTSTRVRLSVGIDRIGSGFAD